MLHDFPSYGCVSGECASVSSGMTWGLVLVGFRGARPGVIKGLYSWGFTVSGHITAFIRTGCIFTSPVVLLVYDQYYPVFCTDYVGTARLGGLSGSTVAMLLGSRAWPCILLAMV